MIGRRRLRFGGRWKRKNHIKRKAAAFSLAFLLIWLTYYTVVFVKEQIRPPIQEMAALTAHQMAAEVINRTLYQEVLPGVKYEELVTIRQDEKGEARYLQTNTVELGKLVTAAGTAIKQNLKTLEDAELKIPLGMFSGLYLFSHLGPELSVPLKPMGAVDVQVSDSFTQAGINQVKHTIYMEVKAEVQIVIPFMEKAEEVELMLPIADAVIMGQVPEVYLSGSGLVGRNSSTG